MPNASPYSSATEPPAPRQDLSAGETMDAYHYLFDLLNRIQVKNDDDRVAARAGWCINLVFHEGDTLAVRERALKVLNHYCENVDVEQMVFWQGGMPAKFSSPGAQKKIKELRVRWTADPKLGAMYFNIASGNPKPPEVWENNAQEYFFRCRIRNSEGIWEVPKWREETPPAMSAMRMCFPVSWTQSRTHERDVAWFTNELVRLMQPFWCTAGWGIVPAVEERNIDSSSRGQQYLYPWLERFPGLDAIPSSALTDPDFNQAMHSINWINYVSDPLLDKLGGREAVKAKAAESPYLGVSEVGNCLMIRAGQFPALGDTLAGHKLPGYGAAARLLKPIRVAAFHNNFVARLGGSYEDEQLIDCEQYLARFDRY